MNPEQAGIAYGEFWRELRSLVMSGQISNAEMNARLEDRKREVQRQLDEERDQAAERESKRALLAHDLEVWRQAYNAALNGAYYIVGAKTYCAFAAEVADRALADYRAQREELGL